MGARPMHYIVPFQVDASRALRHLHARVFGEGAFDGAWRRPASIEEALSSAGESGTRSILDVRGISDTPQAGAASPLSLREYDRYFGGGAPTVEEVVECDSLWEDLQRGVVRIVQARHNGDVVLVFVGYTFD